MQAGELRALRQQLADLLTVPMAPKMSSRYFTGGAAAGVQLMASGGKAPKAPKPGAAAAKGQATKAQEGDDDVADDLVDAQAAGGTVTQAVAYAARLQQSKGAAAAAVAAKSKGKKQVKQVGCGQVPLGCWKLLEWYANVLHVSVG